MARSPAEIQADIAVTRRVVEQRLDGLRRRLPDRWWMPYAMLAGALVTGALLSRVPLLRLVGTGTRAVNAGLMIASTVAAVDRFVAERDRDRDLPARRKAA
jgi:hypothetical protein